MSKVAPPDKTVLRVERLALRYSHFQLGADFRIGTTERLGIFAPSGSGKSTLLRAIAGLETGRPVGGSIIFEGRDITHYPPERRRMGMVFQDYALFSQMTALENVAYALKLQGVAKAERNERALAALKRVRLDARAGANVQKLSGGERQRVAFVRALIGKPRLLLLDEPFSALDTRLREHSRQLLLELIAAEPIPMLLVSHDPADLSKLTDRTLRYETVSAHADRESHQFSD